MLSGAAAAEGGSFGSEKDKDKEKDTTNEATSTGGSTLSAAHILQAHARRYEHTQCAGFGFLELFVPSLLLSLVWASIAKHQYLLIIPSSTGK
jgi:hypothetical protein